MTDTTASSWRPRYHITGERNWINDPNGPIHHRGRYHVFYQANPVAPSWGLMVWGHASSADLVTWTRHPPALTPDAGGPDADGCWSGCTVMVEGRPALYYSGIMGEDAARIESICRAWGTDDLLRWTKDPANPLIPGAPPALGSGYHRDPFLWQDEQGWHMLLGSGTTTGERHGRILQYDSADATTWIYGGVFFESPRWLGKIDLGEHWECPQLLADGDTAVLILSCQVPGADRPLLHAVYFVGTLRAGQFSGGFGGLVDHGDVFYAPASCRDSSGRDLIWGWAQEYAAADRQASFLNVGALSLPRALAVRGGRLHVRPVPELERLRVEPLAPVGPQQGGNGPIAALAAAAQMELLAVVDGAASCAGWTLTDQTANNATVIELDLDHHRLEVTVSDAGTPSRELAAEFRPRRQHELQVFIDGSLVEIFLDDQVAMTTRSYPSSGSFAAAEFVVTGGSGPPTISGWRLAADAIA